MSILGKSSNILMGVFFLLIGCTEIKTTPEEHYLKGLQFAIGGEFELARTEFEKALQMAPYYHDARITSYLLDELADRKITEQSAKRLFSAINHFHHHELDMGLQDLNKAVELSPDYTLNYSFRAEAYFAKGIYDSAILDYTKQLEMLKGIVSKEALSAKDTVEAEDLFSASDRISMLKSELAAAYYRRGLTFKTMGRYDSAIVDILKGNQVNPETNRVYVLRLPTSSKVNANWGSYNSLVLNSNLYFEITVKAILKETENAARKTMRNLSNDNDFDVLASDITLPLNPSFPRQYERWILNNHKVSFQFIPVDFSSRTGPQNQRRSPYRLIRVDNKVYVIMKSEDTYIPDVVQRLSVNAHQQ